MPKTLSDLRERFFEVHGIKRKPKTLQMYQGAWNHALRILKNKPVKSVSRADISELHYQLRSTPVQANRTLAVLHKAFNLSELWGWRPNHSNPVTGIDKNKEMKRRRYPSQEEALRLFKALDASENKVFSGFIWLLILTGCRGSEIRTAKHEWVQPDGLHLPDTKTGERVINLSGAARKAISNLPKLQGNPYLICGRAGNHLQGIQILWKQLCAAADIQGLQMRDLRRYFASLGLSAGLSLEAVGQLLGHSQAQTTKVYAYLLTDAARKASEATSVQIEMVREAGRKETRKSKVRR